MEFLELVSIVIAVAVMVLRVVMFFPRETGAAEQSTS